MNPLVQMVGSYENDLVASDDSKKRTNQVESRNVEQETKRRILWLNLDLVHCGF